MTNNGEEKIILETSRLLLRETTAGDAENAYLLNLDPDVIRFTGDPPFTSVEEARAFLLGYDQYRKYGFGRWAVIAKGSGDFLGWCGLKFTPEKNEHDLGFRFFKKYWNRGYATESGRACIEYGFAEHGISVIVGRAMRHNTASIRVLEKCGMFYWKPELCGGQDGVIYRIENAS